MTAMTAQLHEKFFPLRNLFGEGKILHVSVTLDTVCFDFGASAQRMFPELHLAMRLFHTTGGRALSFMTRSAAELFRRMSGQEHLAVRMGLIGIRLIFKSTPVNPHMTGLTPVYARQRGVKVAAVELIQDNLLNSWDLGNRKTVE